MIDLQDLQAKSDQMNAIDLVNPMIFRVAKVDYFPKKEQPILLHLEGCEGRPYKPCKSMLRGLSNDNAWGMDETKWAGNLIELYNDPTVKWAGKEAGGIRISALSGIAKDFQFTVQLNRSQRVIHTYKKLSDEQPVKREFILTHHQSNIEEAETVEAINEIVKMVNREFGADCVGQLRDCVIAAREALTVETKDNG